MPNGRETERLVAFGQSVYFLTTGIWPIAHIRSFEWVSGPKVDRWLVKTVAALISIVGSAIGLAAWHRRLTTEIRLLAVGSAVALAIVDLIYVARGRIRWVYLLDALAELGLIGAWGWSRRVSGNNRRQSSRDTHSSNQRL
jgi:hypothetical protein